MAASTSIRREIEEVLHEHPDVMEAAVIGIPHDDLGEEVGAAVVLMRLSWHKCGQWHPMPSACSSCGRCSVIGPHVSMMRASAAWAE